MNNVFEELGVDAVISPVTKTNTHKRMDEVDFEHKLIMHGAPTEVPDNLEIIGGGYGVLFHGSKVLVPELKSGFELYNEGLGLNCENVGGYCKGISLTDDLDTARGFSWDKVKYNWLYVIELNDINICSIDVDDACYLYYITDDLVKLGIDLVIINNSREREAVLINKTKAKIKMIIPLESNTDEEIYKMLDANEYYTLAEVDEQLYKWNKHNDSEEMA